LIAGFKVPEKVCTKEHIGSSIGLKGGAEQTLLSGYERMVSERNPRRGTGYKKKGRVWEGEGAPT